MDTRPYKDSRMLGLVVCVLTGLIGLMTLCIAGLDLAIDRLIPGALAGSTPVDRIHALQVVRHAIRAALSTVFMANVVMFLVWLHGAVSNHLALGAEGQEYTPGWSVGYFFVPVVNLVLPYLVMREVWTTSHRLADPSRPSHLWPVLAWWVLYLLSSIVLSVAAHVLGGHTHDLLHILHAQRVEVAGFGLRLASMALFVRMIWTVTRLQHIRAHAPDAGTALSPAPPELTA